MPVPARLTYSVVGAAAALALLALSLSGGAAAGRSDCRIEAQPPTLYAGMIFGAGRVVCSAPTNKISITVVLERDGVEVARVVRNDCQKTSVCWNTTANALDEPADQTWCSRAWGSATGSFLGEARACEVGDF
jgi:hypothetical protein